MLHGKAEVDVKILGSFGRNRNGRAATMLLGASALLTTLSGCDVFEEKGPVRVAAIGELVADASPRQGRLSAPTSLLLDATAQGLVSYDGEGQIEPGLAERWTVTADGRSYIFRLRDATWPNGKEVTAKQVAAILNSYRSPANNHRLKDEFVEVESIHAITDSVLEVRLSMPQPLILDLFAQPSMAIVGRNSGWDRGWGPMRVREKDAKENGGKASPSHPITLVFSPVPDPLAEDPEAAAAEALSPSRQVELVGTSAPRALARFQHGLADAMIGGRYSDLPYFDVMDISQSRRMFDPTSGLFGLSFQNSSGFFANPTHRAAISSLIRRDRIIAAFNAKPWAAQISLRPAPLPNSNLPAPLLPEWQAIDDAARLARAQRLVAQYDGGKVPPIRIALPDGPGSTILFAYIAADLQRAGLRAERSTAAQADLLLIDEVSPNEDPIWALRRLNCRADTLCDEAIDAALSELNRTIDPAERLKRLQSAEQALDEFAPFIPLATPLRWSVFSQRLSGVKPNARAHHPLNRLLAAPK